MTPAASWRRHPTSTRVALIIALFVASAAGDAGAQVAEPNRGIDRQAAVLAEPTPPCLAPPAPAPDSSLRTYGRADYRWALESLTGDTLTLARFRGKVLFINVWATWCPPCIAELESIERLARSLTTAADSSIAMLLITPERRGTVVPVVRRRGLATPVYLERKRTPGAWGLFGLPTSYVVAPDGSIVLHHRGAARWDTDDVRAFLRALGCRR